MSNEIELGCLVYALGEQVYFFPLRQKAEQFVATYPEATWTIEDVAPNDVVPRLAEMAAAGLATHVVDTRTATPTPIAAVVAVAMTPGIDLSALAQLLAKLAQEKRGKTDNPDIRIRLPPDDSSDTE